MDAKKVQMQDYVKFNYSHCLCSTEPIESVTQIHHTWIAQSQYPNIILKSEAQSQSNCPSNGQQQS